MYFATYLLSIQDLIGGSRQDCHPCDEALFSRAFLGVDETRRQKARGMKTVKGRAACLGAGLLLQLAVGEALREWGPQAPCPECGMRVPRSESGGPGSALRFAMQGSRLDSDERDSTAVPGRPGRIPFADGKTDEGEFANDLRCYTVSQLLCLLRGQPRLELSYRYGENGKPYFRDLPFYFNLSHSGEYVLCALSAAEIGADIQRHRGKDGTRLARRFFSEGEIMALEQAGAAGRELFYRLWARKEAYGKLTGRGVMDALGTDMLPGRAISPKDGDVREADVPPGASIGRGGTRILERTSLPDGKTLLWEEYEGLAGYSIALCRYD